MNVIYITKWKSHVGVMSSVTLFTVQHQLHSAFMFFFFFFLLQHISIQQWDSASVTSILICNISPIHLRIVHRTVYTTNITLHCSTFIVEDQNKWQQIIMNCSRCNVKCLHRHSTPWLGLSSFGFSTYYPYYYQILYNNERMFFSFVFCINPQCENENMKWE